MDFSKLEDLLKTRRSILIVLLMALAFMQAYTHRFVQDDAFISFIYARNLVNGQGLTWFGTYVEGYTNFLWVLLMSAGMRIGAEPVLFSYALGILFFLLTMYCVNTLALYATKSHFLSFLATLLFIGNYSVASYATGGLETRQRRICLYLSPIYWKLPEKHC